MKTSTKLKTEVVNVDPALASKWLNALGARQRPVVKNHVAFLAREMREGRFNGLNGQTIVVSDKGRLLDGQHRCTALIETGLTFPLHVVSGVPDTAIDTIDTGRTRQARDIIGAEYGEKGSCLATAVRLLWIRRMFPDRAPHNHMSGRNSVASNAELFTLLEQTPQLLASYDAVKDLPRDILSSGAAVFAHLVCHDIDADVADVMFTKLITGANLDATDPVYVLREKLLVYRTGKSVHRLALVFKTFDLIRSGRQLQQLKWKNKGKHAEPFPWPQVS